VKVLGCIHCKVLVSGSSLFCSSVLCRNNRNTFPFQMHETDFCSELLFVFVSFCFLWLVPLAKHDYVMFG